MSSEQPRVQKTLLLAGFVIAAALVRLVPHPPNFLPTTALAIFAGSQFPSLLAAAVVLAGSLLVSDLVIGFHSTMPFVYASLFLILFAGRRFGSSPVRSGARIASLGLLTLASSVFFFLVSNLGVFLLQDLYPKTGAGLIACYVAALPFFENSLVADLLYTGVLFLCFELFGRERTGARVLVKA